MKAGCYAGCPVMSNWSEGCQPFEQVRTESCGCLCAQNEDVSVYHPPTLHLSPFFTVLPLCTVNGCWTSKKEEPYMKQTNTVSLIYFDIFESTQFRVRPTFVLVLDARRV